MPDNIDSLQIEISANAQSAERSIDRLADTLIRLQSSLKGISGGQFQNLSAGIRQLSDSMQRFSGVVKTADFTRIATGLNKLSAVNVQGVSDASRAISTLTANLGQIGTIAFDSQGIANVANSIAQLGRKTVTQAAANIPILTTSLSGLVTGLNQIGSVQFDISSLSELTSSITKLGGKSATTAASGNITKLATALKQMMTTLSTAPSVSQNLIQMTQALAQFAASGNRAGTATNSLVRNFNLLPASTAKARSGFNGLAGAIGKFYATYWLLIRGMGQFKKAIDISSDLTEVQNVVDVSFGDMSDKMNEFADSALELYGMSELTAKQIGSRFQAMGVSMGFAQKDMTDMSIRLTQLTGDLASFYNVSQDQIATALQSIFTGETEPLRRFGLDLSVATVEAWALAQGLDADMQSMTQAEKTMLRYQYVLANTGQAVGDYQRTISSWANQLRLLTGAFQELGSIVGGVLINAFKPFIQALNSVMSAVINFAQVVSDALGAIFGWEYQTGGGVAQDLEYGASAAEDIEDATGGAAKNAKELNRYIAAWHEVNNMTSDEGSKGSGGGGGGGAGGTGAAASGGEWVQAESLWEKYTSSIDSLYELGDYIGDTLTQAMNDIDWDSVYQSASNFGSGLASFLNGLISPELFGAVGTTIAGALNTALHGLDSFGETFDWEDFGNSIATGINNFFATFDFALLADTLNTWANGLLDAIIAGLDEVNWENIGTQIGTFLEGINLVEIGGKIGKAIWKAINSGFDLYKGMFETAPLETALLSLVGITKALKSNTIKRFITTLSNGISIATNFANALGGSKVAVEALKTQVPILSGTIDTATKAFARFRFGIENGNFLTGASEAIKTIRTNLTGMQKAAITAASGFAEFNLVSGSVSDLATGTGDIAANLIELASGAAIGAAGMYTALGPAGLAMAAVVGIAAAIKGIDEAYRENSGFNDFMDELDEIGRKSDELNTKSEEISKNLSTLRNDYDTVGEASSNFAENLADKYDELQKKTNPTAGDMALMKQYSQELVDMYPELEQFFNNETGLLNTTRDSIQQVIDKNKELAKSNAAFEGMEEAYRQQLEASKKLAEAKENEAAAQEKYNQAYQAYQDYWDEHAYTDSDGEVRLRGDFMGIESRALADAMSEAAEELDKAKEATQGMQDTLDETTESINFYENEWENAVRNSATSSQELKGQFESIGLIFDEKVLKKIQSSGANGSAVITQMFTDMQSGVTVGEETLTAAFESLGIKLPSAFTTALSTQTDSEAQSKLAQMFVKLASGVPASASELRTAFESLGLDLPTAFINSLSTKNSMVQNTVVALLGEIESGVSLKRSELDTIFSQLGFDLPNGFTTSLASQNSVVQQEVITLLTQIESGVDVEESTLQNIFSQLGLDLPDNLKTALDSKNEEVKDQAITLLMQLLNATDEKRGEILEKLKTLGESEGDSLVSGVNSKSQDYKDAGIQANKDIASGVSGEADKKGEGSIYAAGQKTGNSLLDGLKSIDKSIADWWNSLFQNSNVSVSASTNGNRRARNIPAMAKGGIVSNATIAMIGEDGAEAVVPLERNTGWISRIAGNIVDEMGNVRLDLGIDTSQYQFKPSKINTSEVTGEVQEAIQYAFRAEGIIDYNRLGDAVYQAQSQAMKENPVQIGDDDVFRAAQRAQRREYRRTFKTGWAGI